MTGGAAARAADAVAAVREDPAGRVDLARVTYGELGAWARAELAFMRWEVERGVLDPLRPPRPGSPWWRAVNEGLLRDAYEGRALADGSSGDPSTQGAAAWRALFEDPSPRRWYRAHNTSVVAGYLAHADLARHEHAAERLLMNLVLVRVLYAQALEDDVHLGLGPLAMLGRMLADPRACGVGAVVTVPDLYPRGYPLDRRQAAALEHSAHTAEDDLVALLDDDVVLPHLERLYQHGAATLGIHALVDLQHQGRPRYPEAVLVAPDAARGSATAASVLATAPPVHHDLPWVCAQRWEEVLFLSWEVDAQHLQELVPAALDLDLHEGRAFVSLLPLKMAHVHLRDLPGMPGLTNFPELNLRTYVRHDGVPGVYFFSLDAPSAVAVWIGRHVFHVRYDHARMSMHRRPGGAVRFESRRRGSDATFLATYRGRGAGRAAAAGSLEEFLCERYAMFGTHADGSLVRGDIRHAPWTLQDVEVQVDEATVLPAALGLARPPDHAAYSAAVDNVVWPMVRV